MEDAKYLHNGRRLAAVWSRLVPKQKSTGHKTVLQVINRRGHVCLRTLWIHDAKCFGRHSVSNGMDAPTP